jgi:hypothetical protein
MMERNIMQYDLEHTAALLERMPAALNALLRDLPEAWTGRNEGGKTWNAVEVVGHLVQAERTNWMVRARTILEAGEKRTFEPFDRSGYLREREGISLGELLDEFARLRAKNLDDLRALKLVPADLQRRGSHPGLGTVTLGQLFAAWATHDLTHLHQISRVMAHQYRETVGSWVTYLGVLHCAGHGPG